MPLFRFLVYVTTSPIVRTIVVPRPYSVISLMLPLTPPRRRRYALKIIASTFTLLLALKLSTPPRQKVAEPLQWLLRLVRCKMFHALQ